MYQNSVAKPRLDLAGAIRTQEVLSGGIAHLLFPPFPVDKRTASMPKLLATNNQVFAIKHAPKTAYKRVEATLDDDTYNCVEAAIEVPISAEDYDVVGQDGAEQIATEQGRAIVLTAREAALADTLTGAAGETLLTGQVSTPASAENWSEAGGLPIDDIAAADALLSLRQGPGPRWLIISQHQLFELQTNAQIRSSWRSIAGQTDKTATNRRLKLEDLALVLGVDMVLVASARKNTANPGAAAVYAYVWPTNYALLVRGVVNPSDLTEPSFGRMFVWDGANLGAESEVIEENSEEALFVESYRDEAIKSDIIRVGEYTDLKILNLTAAQLIKLPTAD